MSVYWISFLQFSIVLIALSLIEVYVLIALFTNKDVLLDDLQGALAKSSETPEGRQNLKPIEDLLNCCGATAKTRLLYVNEGLCAGELAKTVWEYSRISLGDTPNTKYSSV